MVFGFGRIPIVSWLRAQADESLVHAQQVGEWITTLGAYPSLAIGPLLDSHQTDIGAMLRESPTPNVMRSGSTASCSTPWRTPRSRSKSSRGR
jgi:bacterioferritin (cytochrome b1)